MAWWTILNPTGGRRPGLDLVRLTAALLVVVHHYFGMVHNSVLNREMAYLGPLGVHLFFALSGYLIGTIIFPLLTAPNMSTWARFMARRLLRTVPLYAVVLILLVHLSGSESSVDRNLLRLLTFTQNIVFDPPDAFPVAWSLSVEEWFYLLFSSLLFFCVRAIGLRCLPHLIVFFIITPLIARVALTSFAGGYPTKAALLCLDGIAWGAWIAMRPNFAQHLGYWNTASLAVALGVLSLVCPFDAISFSALSMACALIVACAIGAKLPCKMASPVKNCAELSYPIYLLHVPIILAIQPIHPEWLSVGCGVTLLAAFSLASNRFVERPALSLRPASRAISARQPASATPPA